MSPQGNKSLSTFSGFMDLKASRGCGLEESTLFCSGKIRHLLLLKQRASQINCEFIQTTDVKHLSTWSRRTMTPQINGNT